MGVVEGMKGVVEGMKGVVEGIPRVVEGYPYHNRNMLIPYCPLQEVLVIMQK